MGDKATGQVSATIGKVLSADARAISDLQDRANRSRVQEQQQEEYIGSDDWLDAHLRPSHWLTSTLNQRAVYNGVMAQISTDPKTAAAYAGNLDHMRTPCRKLALVGIIGSMLLTGCVTASSPIAVIPSDETYRMALARLTPHERLVISNGLHLHLIDDNASYAPPSDPMSHKSLAKFFTIDYRSFVWYINDRLAPNADRNVDIVTISSLESDYMDTGRMSYRFTVEIETKNGAGKTIAKGAGFGPVFSAWHVANTDTNPASVQCANVGFFVGLLRAVIELQRQVDQSAP